MPVAVSAYTAPTFLELVPEELDLRVFRHAIDTIDGPVPCWSYVSDGLRRFGQKEIVLTLRRRPGEPDDAFPRDPLDYFLLMHRLATDGKTVEAGGYSRFARPGGFLGRDGPVGMMYVTATPMRGVNFPDKPLAAHLVTAEEVEAIRVHGTYRLLSLLGFRAHYFPYPPWSERMRGSVLTSRDFQQSLLSQVPVATARGLMTRRQRNQVHLHLANDKAIDLFEERINHLETDGPFLLLTDPDPEARARLVWKPGMPVETIALDNRPEAMLTGGFLAVFVGRRASEGVHVCEDGFALKVRPKTWENICEALIVGEPFTMPGTGSAMNLVCGLSSHVPAVRPVGGRFYQDDSELQARIKPEELTWFDRRVGHVVEDHFTDLPSGDGESLSVYCAIRPGGHAKFWTECRPNELDASSRNLLLRRLSALKPPEVKQPVAWSMRFDLWGGSGDPSHFAHMPGEWTVAFAPHEKPQIPDQILDRVWPMEQVS